MEQLFNGFDIINKEMDEKLGKGSGKAIEGLDAINFLQNNDIG